jgi:hypothetical protein
VFSTLFSFCFVLLLLDPSVPYINVILDVYFMHFFNFLIFKVHILIPGHYRESLSIANIMPTMSFLFFLMMRNPSKAGPLRVPTPLR